MRKKTYNALIILFSLILLTMGAFFSVKPEKKQKSELPILTSTACYPYMSLPQLANTANVIIDAEVIKVNDSIIKEIPVSLTLDTKASDVITYPVTPVTLKVKNYIKGTQAENEFIYYEDGGITDDYIQLPPGYAMEEGMEAVIFLNDAGYGWGEYGLFPVSDNQVVIDQDTLNFVDKDKVRQIQSKTLDSAFRNQIDAQNIYIMDKEDFISSIRSML